MALVPHVLAASGGVTIAAGVTNYLTPAMSGFNAGFTNEVEGQDRVRTATAGTWSKMAVYVKSNATTGSSTIKFRKNGANGNQVITISAGATGLIPLDTLTNTDAVVDGDLIAIQVVNGGGGALVITFIILWLTPTSGNVAVRTGFVDTSFNTNNTTAWGKIVGRAALYTAVEANAQIKMPVAVTGKNLRTYVYGTNGRSTGTDLGTRIGGVASSMKTNYAGGATGEVEDTTNTDTVAVDNQYDMYLTTLGAGGGTISLSLLLMTLEAAAKMPLIAAGPTAGITVSSATTIYTSPIGGRLGTAAAEAQVRIPIRTNMTISKLRVRIASDSLNGNCVVTLRKNGADTTLVNTISGGSGAGTYDDAGGNSVTVADGDDISLSIVTAGSSGSIVIHHIIMAADLGVQAYTLTADSFSVAVSVSNATLSKAGGRTLVADPLSFNVSAVNAGLKVGRKVLSSPLAYNVTMQPVIFEHAVQADAPAFLITISDVNLVRGGAGDRTIAADSIAFNIAMTNATLQFGGRRLRAESIPFFITIRPTISSGQGGITASDNITSATLN